MREIKFRALDEECEWIYGMPLTHVEYEEKEFPLMRNCDETGYWGIKKIHPKTLGQYTGLKDKNGVDIYEGDIVECFNDGLSEVLFRKGSFGTLTYTSKGVDFYPFNEIYGACEIIGNIYENKELLESEAE